MKRLTSVISAVFFCACSFHKDLDSKWSVLQNVDDLDCKEWPKGNGDIGVKRLHVIENSKSQEVLAQITNRQGQTRWLKANYKNNSDLERKPMTEYIFDEDAEFIGGWMQNDIPYAALTVPEGEEKNKLQIRDLRTNSVVFEESMSKGVDSGEFKLSLYGIVGLMSGDSLRPTWIDAGLKKSKINYFQDFPADSLLVGNDSVSIASLRTNSTGKFISLHDFGKGGTLTKGKNSRVFPADLESWALTMADSESFYIGAVVGDSMLGQSTLEIWDSASSDIPMQRVKLDDLHVSEPVFYSSDSQTWVLIMKWIDGEATLGAVKVQPGQIVEENQGVFLEGTALTQVFPYEGDHLGVFRKAKGEHFEYQLCELSLP